MTVTFLKKITFLLIILLVLFFPFKKVLAAEKWCGYKATTGIVTCKFGDCTSDATCIPATCYDDKADCDKIAIGANQIITDKAAADAAAAAQQQAAAQATSNKWCGYKTSSGVVSCKQGICSADPACIPVTCYDVKTDCDKIAITATQSIADKTAADAAAAAQQQAAAQATANNWCGYKTSSGIVSCKQGVCSADPACIPVTCWPVQADCIKSAAEATKILKDQIITIACGNQQTCTKSDKECNSGNDCIYPGGTGICKDNFCWLDEVAMKQFKESLSLFGIVADLQIRKPILAITIPQLDFTDVQNSVDEEGYLHLPYIGEYISAIYKFAMVIVSIIGVIMIIVVGVKIVVLGGEEKVAGFKRIGQITIGLFIAWGSYAILYNINPDLVNFKALKVQYIEREEILFGDYTSNESDDNTSTSGFLEKFSECPVKMNSGPVTKIGKNNKPVPDPEGNQPRKQEFVQKILDSKILTGDFSNRAMLAAEAAYKCKIFFGTCGQGTTAIYALAGVNGSFGLNNKCLKQTCNMGGDPIIKKKEVHSVYSTKIGGVGVAKLLQGMMCDGIPVCQKAKWAVNWKDPCFKDSKAASNKLKEILKATGKWDEEQWFNDLKPGDYYDIANWNTTCSPTHSAMFLGWKDKANHVAFQAGGDMGNFFRFSTHDFNKTGAVIIMIQRPQDK